MKKLVFLFLSMFMLGLSGCMDKGDNIEPFPTMPAIVSFDNIIQPVIITPWGTYYLSGLPNDLMDEDAIWTQFSVNYDQQPPSSKYYVVSDFQYYKVGRNYPIETAGGMSANNFDFPLKNVEPIGRVVYDWGDVLFFGFELTASSDQEFIYEMTYDPNEIDVVYLRAKENSSMGAYPYFYAFDMRYYYTRLPGYSDHIVKFNIMYQTGVDEEGNDIYKAWDKNPCEIQLKTD